MKRAQNVLIVTAGLGNGHKSAANGLKQQEEELGNNVQIIAIEDISIMGKIMKFLFSKLPESILNNLYDSSNYITPKIKDKLFYLWGFRSLVKYIKNTDPDKIIYTFPALALITPKEFKGIVTIQVTDYQTFQLTWLWGNFDTISVLDKKSYEYFLQYVSYKKIKIVNFPLESKMKTMKTMQQGHKLKEILLLFHFYLFGNEKEMILKIQKKFPDYKIIILAGKNYNFFTKTFSENDQENPVIILPWIDNINEYYERVSIVGGKCGGAFISEVMQRNLPLIITGVFSRQEEGNFAYLQNVYSHNLISI